MWYAQECHFKSRCCWIIFTCFSPTKSKLFWRKLLSSDSWINVLDTSQLTQSSLRRIRLHTSYGYRHFIQHTLVINVCVTGRVFLPTTMLISSIVQVKNQDFIQSSLQQHLLFEILKYLIKNLSSYKWLNIQPDFHFQIEDAFKTN